MKVFIFTFIIFSLGWWGCYLCDYLHKKKEEKRNMPTIQNEPIGYLIIQDRLKLYIYKPINKFHKLMMKLCFGWEYEPYEGDK